MNATHATRPILSGRMFLGSESIEPAQTVRPAPLAFVASYADASYVKAENARPLRAVATVTLKD